MSMILMIHTDHACKEYVLPCLYNSDFSIVLSKQIFDFKKDITIKLEIIEENWRFSVSTDYWILKENELCFKQSIQTGDIFDFISEQGERAAIIVCKREEHFKSFQKYDVSHVSEISIGKDENNAIVYDFHGLVSRKHARLYREGEDWFIEDNSANGIFFQWKRVDGQKKIAFGEWIYIFGMEILLCNDLLCVNGIEPVKGKEPLTAFEWKERKEEISSKKKEKQEVFYHRPPRTMPSIVKETIELEFPSVEEQEQRLKEEKNTSLISFGRFQIGWKKKRKKESLPYQGDCFVYPYLKEQMLQIKEKYQENQRILRENYPSATVCCDYDRNTSTLWNRNFSHKDILFLRLGIGQRPFEVNIEMPNKAVSLQSKEQGREIQKKYQNLTDVPVGIDLLKHRLCGLIGGEGKQGAYQIVQAMLAQICANICYTDVKVAVLYNEKSEEEQKKWEFVKWLPHIWNQERTMRFFATNREEAREVCHELARIFRKRAEQTEEKRPHYILFVADTRLLDGELLETYIYKNKQEYGLSTCLLVENYEDLPNCCGQIIQKNEQFSGMYHVMDGWEKRKEIVFDQVSGEKWKQFSKRLACLKVKEEQENKKLPKRLTFLEMYGVERIEEIQVENRWRKQRTYESMRVCIGKKTGDRLCYLDIHENYHGPHGLLAGTTGAGKSETIQTFLLSLALNFSPKDVSFLLIDYKGGGMAQQFAGLPHLAGYLSNLSKNQVRRAMVSIQSEIKRRQRLFQQYGISHIHTYTKMRKSEKLKEDLCHLCIVVDEFAELKKEEPEFLKELISVAQVGRSLGIHLILATQKPCGTVDENIWSNSHFRICLRVQSEEDSMEVLKKADAAFLTQAGQGYLQVGRDEVYEPFQTGWSGAAYKKKNVHGRAIMLTGTGKEAWLGVCERRTEQNGQKEDITELAALVAYMKELAEEKGFGTSKKLWLPMLPDTILLERVEESKKKWTGTLCAAVGLCDDPEEQRQIPYQIEFSGNGHCCVIGTVSSGKSSALQTMVWSLLRNYPADVLHVYLLDFGNGMLSVFQDAPQVGGVIMEQETEKLKRFLHFLKKSIQKRKQQLQGGDYVQYVQNTENKLPAIVVVIDHMAAFRETSNDSYTDELYHILREGIGCGIYFVLAAGGFGVHEIPGRMQDLFQTKVALALPDKYKYMEILGVSKIPFLPERQKRGRGLVVVGEKPLELQAALAGDNDVYERGEVLKVWCKKQKQEWNGECAQRIPDIPTQPKLKMFTEQNNYQKSIAKGNRLPVGYHGMEADILSMNLRTQDWYLIGGKRGSGRKNAAKVLMHAAQQMEGNLFVFGTKKQALKEYAKKHSLSYLEGRSDWHQCFTELMPEWKKRNEKKKEYMKQGLSEEKIQKNMEEFLPVFFVVEDLYDFMEQIYEEEKGSMKDFLENVLEKGIGSRMYWIGIFDVEQVRKCMAFPAFVKMTEGKNGMYLGGTLSEQNVFSYENLSFEEERKENKTGTGYAFSKEEKDMAVPIIVPLV